MLIIGTPYFTSRSAAALYYRPYHYSDTIKAVDRKIAEGEIHIGKPDLKAGETLSVIDNGMRYAILTP